MKAYPEEINAFVEMNAQSPRELQQTLPWLKISAT